MDTCGETTPGQRLLARLSGRWRLTRVLTGIGRMTGTALFRPVDPGFTHYREDGVLTLGNGQSHEVYREYHYRLADGVIRICFAEPGPPRTFHVLRLVDGSADDTHVCGSDVYTGRYEFTGPDRFTVGMRVIGPHKDYATHTVYDRAGGAAD